MSFAKFGSYDVIFTVLLLGTKSISSKSGRLINFGVMIHDNMIHANSL